MHATLAAKPLELNMTRRVVTRLVELVHGTGLAGIPALHCVAILLGMASSAAAGTVTIDSFNNPDPGNLYVISTAQTNPSVFVEQEPGIIGGEREFQIQVSGIPGPFSALGVVMDGGYVFGSSNPAAKVIFQYDGVDQEESGVAPSNQLVNSMGILRNLGSPTGGNGIKIDFLALDSGPSATKIDLTITLTGPGGTSAHFSGFINDSNGPFTYDAPYAAFVMSPGFSTTAVTSLTFEFNAMYRQEVDFEIDRIYAVPEPATWTPALLGLLGLIPWAYRRRCK